MKDAGNLFEEKKRRVEMAEDGRMGRVMEGRIGKG
jgi:hypothetical protein